MSQYGYFIRHSVVGVRVDQLTLSEAGDDNGRHESLGIDTLASLETLMD